MVLQASQPLGWRVLYFIYPFIVFLYFSTHEFCDIMLHRQKRKTRPQRLSFFRRLLFAFLCTYLIQIAIIGIQFTVANQRLSGDCVMVGHLYCVLIYSIQLTFLRNVDATISMSLYGSWLIALPFELVITVLELSSILRIDLFVHLQFPEQVLLGFRCLSLLLLAGGLFLDFILKQSSMSTDEERQGLLDQDPDVFPNARGTSQATNHTPVDPESIWERREREAREAVEKRLRESESFLMYMREYTVSIS